MGTMNNINQMNNSRTGSIFKTKALVIIGMLSALSIILMLFEVPLWFAPNFYKIDLSDVPAVIGAFALGPIAGVMIELIKILINYVIEGTQTMGIGEIANFIFGCSFVIPSVLIYSRKKSFKSAISGLLAGTVSLTIFSSILNAFVVLPAYAFITMKDVPHAMDVLVEMGTKVNPGITNLMTFILWAVAPFNLLKGVVITVITILLYKRLEKVIRSFAWNEK